jgi:glutathione S-transferase
MLQLVIANKLYSSWSMRPWLVLHAFAIPFKEIVIPLRQDDSKARLASYSPSGKLPVLLEDGLLEDGLLEDGLLEDGIVIWESLAIIEYLAEAYRDKGIWPQLRAARAHARALSNEMHGGFMPLRAGCPMNLGARFETPDMTEALKANVDRVEQIWAEAKTKYRGEGPYLYGGFTAADAMFAPVVSRLDSYQIPVKPETRAYMDAVLAHPSYVAWKEAALKEPWSITDYEAGHTIVETYR